MRIPAINNYNYTPIRQRNTMPQQSFEAVQSISSASQYILLRSENGMEILKAFIKNPGIKRFCDERDVKVYFCYSCDYLDYNNMQTTIVFDTMTKNPYDSPCIKINTGSLKLPEKERYQKIVDGINKITYEDLINSMGAR